MTCKSESCSRVRRLKLVITDAFYCCLAPDSHVIIIYDCQMQQWVGVRSPDVWKNGNCLGVKWMRWFTEAGGMSVSLKLEDIEIHFPCRCFVSIAWCTLRTLDLQVTLCKNQTQISHDAFMFCPGQHVWSWEMMNLNYRNRSIDYMFLYVSVYPHNFGCFAASHITSWAIKTWPTVFISHNVCLHCLLCKLP